MSGRQFLSGTSIGDDSHGFVGEGYWNDAGTSSYTMYTVHATSAELALKATRVWHGTIVQYGFVFTHGAGPWHLRKRYSIEIVQKNS